MSYFGPSPQAWTSDWQAIPKAYGAYPSLTSRAPRTVQGPPVGISRAGCPAWSAPVRRCARRARRPGHGRRPGRRCGRDVRTPWRSTGADPPAPEAAGAVGTV